MVLSIGCDAAFYRQLAEWNIDNLHTKAVRSVRVNQWTTIISYTSHSTQFHPISIDEMVSVFEWIEAAGAEGLPLIMQRFCVAGAGGMPPGGAQAYDEGRSVEEID
ncbi:hypothetical protein EHS25_005591 [Saitozyma podzolica]|uniref:Uncharacterized protein n=1 Tax=Saitozyma podzolica TaxID=1890683 RepID=A0A427XY24_9TREE|nr:hypothetical protein EHS25_005591 [Saitozyma podzolica]